MGGMVRRGPLDSEADGNGEREAHVSLLACQRDLVDRQEGLVRAGPAVAGPGSARALLHAGRVGWTSACTQVRLPCR
jgi:hypothetical protein